MNPLQHILDKYKVDTSKPGPYFLQAGRYKCLPILFNELGFNIGAEVGVHKGAWAGRITRRLPHLKLFLIDLWESYTGYKDFPAAKVTEALVDAKRNTEGRNVVFIKEWSHIAAEQFEDESLDFVYLDANHTFEYVVQDLAAWAPKVRKGGLVCGHDYDDYSKSKRHDFMNVMEAVDGWCASKKIKHLFILTNNKARTWVYVKE